MMMAIVTILDFLGKMLRVGTWPSFPAFDPFAIDSWSDIETLFSAFLYQIRLHEGNAFFVTFGIKLESRI